MMQQYRRRWTLLLIVFALAVAWSKGIGAAEAQQNAAPATEAQAAADSSVPSTHRLYDDLGFFFDNSAGKDFTITLDVRDINHISRGPSEMLVKVYNPDGKLAVREVIPDDGINPNVPGGTPGAWDHEAFYYATEYDRGLQPLVAWSQWSEPARLAEALACSGVLSHAIGDGALGVAAPPERVGEVASANGIVLHELTTARATLEEVFLSLTDSGAGEGSDE